MKIQANKQTEGGVQGVMLDERDIDGVTESLAEAFADHVARQNGCDPR